MLLKLSHDEIVTYWDDIKDTLRYALPPMAVKDGEDPALAPLLEMLLADFMQAWALLGEEKVHAIVITVVQRDLGTDTKALLIYSLYGFSMIHPALWREGLETLKKYARDNGCMCIIGYTKVPRIVEVVKELGGDASTAFIRMEV